MYICIKNTGKITFERWYRRDRRVNLSKKTFEHIIYTGYNFVAVFFFAFPTFIKLIYMTMLLLMKPSGEMRKNIGNKIGVAKKNSFYIFSCGEGSWL